MSTDVQLRPESRSENTSMLISYPKSGRTWLRYLFKVAEVDCPMTHAGYGSNPRSPRFGRPFSGVTETANSDRSVLLVRNPIDTAVSLYFQIHKRELHTLTNRLLHLPRLALSGRLPPKELADFLDHPGFGVRKVCAFNRAWIDTVASDPRFLVMQYETLLGAPEDSFKTLLGHLVPEREFDFPKLVSETSFERMQAMEAGTNDRALKLGAKSKSPQSRKVRRGKAGGYVDYLDTETSRKFEAICAEYGLLIGPRAQD